MNLLKYCNIRLLVITLLLLFTSTFASADQLIIEPEMGRAPIIDAINTTQHSLKIVMYGFTDEDLFAPILQQKNRGRTVKLLLERTPYRAETENNKIVQLLDKHRINWQGSIPTIALIHQKTLIIDGKRALIMTFNFTRSTFKHDRNFALLVDNQQMVKEIESVFDADWHHKASLQTHERILYSPENSRDRLLYLVARAKQTIWIYAQNVSDYKITGALAKAARKGVDVRILTSAKLKQKQSDYLKRAGVKVRRSNHYYIHAKALIIDNSIAIVGSINFTRPSFDLNRELAAVSIDASVVSALKQTFEKDWDATENNVVFKRFPDQKVLHETYRIIKGAIGF